MNEAMPARCLPICLVLLCCGVLFVRAGEHTKDSLDAVKQNLNTKKAVLIDVRERKEWDKGHLASAQLLSLSELKKLSDNPAELAKRLPKDRVVYCHCAKGVRALMAGDMLEKLGYDVRPLAAGFDDLLSAGFEKAPSTARLHHGSCYRPGGRVVR